MTFTEILQNKIELVMENSDGLEVIRPNLSISQLVTKAQELALVDAQDMLLVYIDDELENHPVRGVITNRDFSNFLDFLLKSLETHTSRTHINTINIESEFPLRYFVSKNDPMNKALEIFKANVVDTIVVLDENQRFVGKVKRNKFLDKVNSMFLESKVS